MLKFGITNLEEIKNFDNDKKISITLYPEVQNLANSEDLAERILLLFTDERGAYKRTYQKRFEVFDQEVLSILKEAFVDSEKLFFHDVGVSDGRTALDFFQKIVKEFPHVNYLASDYSPSVYVLEQDKVKITLSKTGKLLEMMFPPFVFNKIKRDRFIYVLNFLVRFCTEIFIAQPLIQKYKQGLISAKEIQLFAPQVLKQAQNDPRFKLRQHDLLKPLDEPFHIIRAMNILNPSYFSKSEFLTVIKNIHQGLKKEGILITGSNQGPNSLVHGGIYKKEKMGFKKMFQSGKGSPIEDLLLP